MMLMPRRSADLTVTGQPTPAEDPGRGCLIHYHLSIGSDLASERDRQMPTPV